MKRPTFFTTTSGSAGNKRILTMLEAATGGVLMDLGQSAVRSEVAALIDDISGPSR
jgi:hypothetical protein